jgi:hypothetical protein
MAEFKDAREKVLHEAEYGVDEDDTRKKLVLEFLGIKAHQGGPNENRKNAIAFVKKMMETEDPTTVEIYCHFLQKRKYLKPAEFYDFLATLDLGEQDKLAEMAREMMRRVVD